jgi:SAM-dependent methyltransferase
MNFNRLASGIFRAVRNAPAMRRAIARSKKLGTTPKDWFSGVDDNAWLWMNTVGRRRIRPLAAIVPGMPDADTQANFTGSTEDLTLREGFAAYQLFKRCYETHVGEIASCKGILDFGCGWGRIMRFFLRDVPPEKISGVDHSEEIIQICRETNQWCRFTAIEPDPPTSLEPDSFDVIYLYSVFSHLPEDMHLALLHEFKRLLVPGGLLIATTRGRDFIQYCASLRNDPQLQDRPKWVSQLGNIWLDEAVTLAAYDRGGFCYESFGVEGRWSFWGEACIPKAYVQKRWTEVLDVLDYIDNRAVCEQNVIVARKRRA